MKVKNVRATEEEYYSRTGIYRSWPTTGCKDCNNLKCSAYGIETFEEPPGKELRGSQKYHLVGISRRKFNVDQGSWDRLDTRIVQAATVLLKNRTVAESTEKSNRVTATWRSDSQSNTNFDKMRNPTKN